jgi:hypothetical protein
MRSTKHLAAFLCSTILLSSCISFAEPQRPGYTGPDLVDHAREDQLIGSWIVLELNPLQNSGLQQSTEIEYKADGTVVGHTRINDPELASFGPIELELNGQWSLELDKVRHENIVLKSRNESGASSLISAMLNEQKGISGAATIYEISDKHIVMVGDDGAAMRYDRK